MNKAYSYIKEGMYGLNLQKTMNSILHLRDTNPIMWFVIYKILETINDEWEEEILPIKRVNEIEEKFKERIITLLKKEDCKSFNEIKNELEDLIKVYIKEYIS